MLPVRAEHASPAVAEAKLDGDRAESREDGHVHAAGLPRAEHDCDRLWHARQESGHAIALLEPARAQPPRDLRAQPAELLEREGAGGAALAYPAKRGAVTARVAGDDGPREIDLARVRPAERLQGVFPAEGAGGLGVRRPAHRHRSRET